MGMELRASRGHGGRSKSAERSRPNDVISHDGAVPSLPLQALDLLTADLHNLNVLQEKRKSSKFRPTSKPTVVTLKLSQVAAGFEEPQPDPPMNGPRHFANPPKERSIIDSDIDSISPSVQILKVSQPLKGHLQFGNLRKETEVMQVDYLEISPLTDASIPTQRPYPKFDGKRSVPRLMPSLHVDSFYQSLGLDAPSKTCALRDGLDPLLSMVCDEHVRVLMRRLFLAKLNAGLKHRFPAFQYEDAELPFHFQHFLYTFCEQELRLTMVSKEASVMEEPGLSPLLDAFGAKVLAWYDLPVLSNLVAMVSGVLEPVIKTFLLETAIRHVLVGLSEQILIQRALCHGHELPRRTPATTFNLGKLVSMRGLIGEVNFHDPPALDADDRPREGDVSFPFLHAIVLNLLETWSIHMATAPNELCRTQVEYLKSKMQDEPDALASLPFPLRRIATLQQAFDDHPTYLQLQRYYEYEIQRQTSEMTGVPVATSQPKNEKDEASEDVSEQGHLYKLIPVADPFEDPNKALLLLFQMLQVKKLFNANLFLAHLHTLLSRAAPNKATHPTYRILLSKFYPAPGAPAQPVQEDERIPFRREKEQLGLEALLAHRLWDLTLEKRLLDRRPTTEYIRHMMRSMLSESEVARFTDLLMLNWQAGLSTVLTHYLPRFGTTLYQIPPQDIPLSHMTLMKRVSDEWTRKLEQAASDVSYARVEWIPTLSVMGLVRDLMELFHPIIKEKPGKDADAPQPLLLDRDPVKMQFLEGGWTTRRQAQQDQDPSRPLSDRAMPVSYLFTNAYPSTSVFQRLTFLASLQLDRHGLIMPMLIRIWSLFPRHRYLLLHHCAQDVIAWVFHYLYEEHAMESLYLRHLGQGGQRMPTSSTGWIALTRDLPSPTMHMSQLANVMLPLEQSHDDSQALKRLAQARFVAMFEPAKLMGPLEAIIGNKMLSMAKEQLIANSPMLLFTLVPSLPQTLFEQKDPALFYFKSLMEYLLGKVMPAYVDTYHRKYLLTLIEGLQGYTESLERHASAKVGSGDAAQTTDKAALEKLACVKSHLLNLKILVSRVAQHGFLDTPRSSTPNPSKVSDVPLSKSFSDLKTCLDEFLRTHLVVLLPGNEHADQRRDAALQWDSIWARLLALDRALYLKYYISLLYRFRDYADTGILLKPFMVPVATTSDASLVASIQTHTLSVLDSLASTTAHAFRRSVQGHVLRSSRPFVELLRRLTAETTGHIVTEKKGKLGPLPPSFLMRTYGADFTERLALPPAVLRQLQPDLSLQDMLSMYESVASLQLQRKTKEAVSNWFDRVLAGLPTDQPLVDCIGLERYMEQTLIGVTPLMDSLLQPGAGHAKPEMSDEKILLTFYRYLAHIVRLYEPSQSASVRSKGAPTESQSEESLDQSGSQSVDVAPIQASTSRTPSSMPHAVTLPELGYSAYSQLEDIYTQRDLHTYLLPTLQRLKVLLPALMTQLQNDLMHRLKLAAHRGSRARASTAVEGHVDVLLHALHLFRLLIAGRKAVILQDQLRRYLNYPIPADGSYTRLKLSEIEPKSESHKRSPFTNILIEWPMLIFKDVYAAQPTADLFLQDPYAFYIERWQAHVKDAEVPTLVLNTPYGRDKLTLRWSQLSPLMTLLAWEAKPVDLGSLHKRPEGDRQRALSQSAIERDRPPHPKSDASFSSDPHSLEWDALKMVRDAPLASPLPKAPSPTSQHVSHPVVNPMKLNLVNVGSTSLRVDYSDEF